METGKTLRHLNQRSQPGKTEEDAHKTVWSSAAQSHRSIGQQFPNLIDILEICHVVLTQQQRKDEIYLNVIAWGLCLTYSQIVLGWGAACKILINSAVVACEVVTEILRCWGSLVVSCHPRISWPPTEVLPLDSTVGESQLAELRSADTRWLFTSWDVYCTVLLGYWFHRRHQ